MSILFRTYEPKAGFDPSEPRDPHGEWTSGGGGDEGEGKAPGGKAPKNHPGKGYSKNARLLADGTIYTTDVDDAARALHEGKKVELDQVKKVSTLIHKLGEEAQRWQKAGKTAPVFNLCDVTVVGTNLFCAETKGIPRVKMPQLDRKQTKAFIEYLKAKGYKVERERERADHLRATQDELSGAKVAANMDKLQDVEDHINKRLVVSKDDYILDGHHHWAAKIGLDAAEGKLSNATKMPISRVNISITKLLEEAEKFTGGKGHKPASEAASAEDALMFRRFDPPPFVVKAKRPKTEIELWPEKDQDRDDFLDYCIDELTPCLGADRADEVCSAKWEASKELGKKGFVSRADLGDDLSIEPCGKSCLACDHAPLDLRDEKRAHEDVDYIQDPKTGQMHGSHPHAGGEEAKEPKPAAAAKEPEAKAPKLDPEVVNVGGDAFNQEIAKQLEFEYQKARPALATLAGESVCKEAEEPEPEEDEEPEYFPPEDWDSLSADAQQEAEELWISKNEDDWIQSESDNYYSEYAPAEARKVIADDFNASPHRENITWVADAIEEARESETDDPADAEWRHDYPFTDKQILDAIHLDYTGEGGSYPMPDKPDFEWDDAYLDSLKATPKEPELPGIEPKHGSELLTEKMRGEIERVIGDAFDKHGDSEAGDMEVPEWVTESAKDSMGEYFGQLSDKEKWKFVTNNSEILDHEAEKYGQPTQAETAVGPIKLPNVYDPLNETSGNDYKRTQQLARYLSVERAMQIMQQRGLDEALNAKGEIGKVEPEQLRSNIARLDAELWRSWKDSSTTASGKLLQVATAAELGGRLRMKHFSETREQIVERANKLYEHVGGFEGIKAYVRAKWETTQYLLDKAGIKTLDLYRGYEEEREKYDKMFDGKRRVIPYEEWERRHYAAHQDVQGPYASHFAYMPTLDVERNGAASATTDINVANAWRTGRNTKVTLRAQVPRTAAVSVPAYGINIHTEHEVVIAGTAWKGWDAWAGKAPPLGNKSGSVPMMHAA